MKHLVTLFLILSFSTRAFGELIPLWSANLHGEEIKYYINLDRLKKLEYHNLLEEKPQVDIQSAAKTAMSHLKAKHPNALLSFYHITFSDFSTDYKKMSAYEVQITLREPGVASVQMMHVYILMDGKILKSMDSERFKRMRSSEVIVE